MESYMMKEIKEIETVIDLYLSEKISHAKLNAILHKTVIDYYNYITIQERKHDNIKN